MKKGNLIASAVIVSLVISLMLSGCTQVSPTPSGTAIPTATATVVPTGTATPTQPVGTELTYRCLNPLGTFVPVQTYSLAPRLDTIEGKTIYISALAIQDNRPH